MVVNTSTFKTAGQDGARSLAYCVLGPGFRIGTKKAKTPDCQPGAIAQW